MNSRGALKPTGAPTPVVVFIAAALLLWGFGAYYSRSSAERTGEISMEVTESLPEPPARPSFPQELLDRLRENDRPLLDLEARMWAHTVQEGDVQLDTLEYYSRDWVMSGEHKEELFRRIRMNLALGSVLPLTEEETKELDAAKARARKILEEYMPAAPEAGIPPGASGDQASSRGEQQPG